jgi:hypothetical protein
MFPERTVFVDLFGGGGAITSAALEYKQDTLFECFKFDKVVYNEVNKLVYTLYSAFIRGEITKEQVSGYVSREAFYDVKNNTDKYPTLQAAIILFVWSFNNAFGSYIFPSREKTKEQSNDVCARFENGRLSLLAKHNIDTSKLETFNEDYHSVSISSNAVVYCDIPYYRTCDYGNVGNVKEITYFRHQTDAESQNCTNISEQLDCKVGCREKHAFTNCYHKGRHYDKVFMFDYDKFYEWALGQDYPVFVSEYNMPSEFECVGEWQRATTGNGMISAENAPIERLYWNGKGLGVVGKGNGLVKGGNK